MASEKYTWIERAKETHNFHIRKLQENSSWTLRKTADSLRRALGSVSEDLLIASWLRTHRAILEKFEYAKDALIFIREKEKEKMEEID